MRTIYFRFFGLLFFLLPAILLSGQVSQGGEPLSFRLKSAAEIPLINLEFPGDVNLQEEEQGQLPYRVAIGIDVNIDVTEDGNWETIPGKGRICRLDIRSDGAKAMHLFFEEYALPDGAELYIYNPDRSRILGAFTSFNNKATGKLAVQPVEGEELRIEYFEPVEVDYPAALRIGSVGHNYRENILQDASGYGDSQKCNKDINCTPGVDWQMEKRSVCKILYQKPNGNFYICTGALINNTRHDGAPYFLTANHCVSSGTEAASIVLYFNYESPTCNGVDGPTNQTVSGSSILATTYKLDFSLVELAEEPPVSYEPFYAGWDARDQPPDNVVSIHHPAGDVKKISTYTKSPVTGDFTHLYDYDDSTHWYIDDWTLGITEGGSSGSPLFNSKGHIVGDLTGGAPNGNCTSSDAYYAKLSDSWADYTSSLKTHLKPWLDSDSSGVMFIDGHDPLNPVGLSPDYPSDAEISIFPNPATGYLYIQSRGLSPIRVELMDLSGKLLYREEIEKNTTRLSLSDQWKGMYILRLTQGNRRWTEKLIIQ